MIVDDERLVRWSLRQKCEEWGYHVIESEAGEPALKLAQHESPELVDCRRVTITRLQASNLAWPPVAKSFSPSNSMPS
jgi:CheY-like chemotaxis protein